MKKGFNKGFTLIELLVVIAIIGILSSIVLVAVGPARNKATASKVVSDMSQMMTAVELAGNDNCTVMTATQGAALQCTTPALATKYIASVPTAPSGYTYTFTITNPSTSDYTVQATGFGDKGMFICSGGTCVCYSGGADGVTKGAVNTALCKQ